MTGRDHSSQVAGDGAGAPGAGMTAGARRHLSLSHVPEMLYGAIVAASVLAVASVHTPAGGRVVLVTMAVAIVYWLAHVYVDAVGGRFTDPHHSMGSRLLRAFDDNWSVLFGALPPIAVLVVLRLFGASAQTAAWVALWATVGLLLGVGAVAAWRGGARGWPLVGEVVIAGAFGLLVVLLKYALH